MRVCPFVICPHPAFHNNGAGSPAGLWRRRRPANNPVWLPLIVRRGFFFKIDLRVRQVSRDYQNPLGLVCSMPSRTKIENAYDRFKADFQLWYDRLEGGVFLAFRSYLPYLSFHHLLQSHSERSAVSGVL